MAMYNIVERYKRPTGYDALIPLSSHNVVPCSFTESGSTINASPIVPQQAWDMSYGVTISLFGASGVIPTLPTAIVIYGESFTLDSTNGTLLQRSVNRTGAALVHIVRGTDGGYAFYCNSDSQTSLRADVAAQVDVSGITGVLPPEKGGTGTTSITALRQAMGLGAVGSTLTIAQGGTGATSAAGAKNTLGFATRAEYSATLGTAWSGGNPFTQSVAINGILATDTPIISPTLTSNLGTDTPRIQGWGNINRAYTYNGGITFVSYNFTSTVAIPFRCLVIR